MSVLPDSSSQESSDPLSAGAEVAGSPEASFSLPGQGSDLIKMHSLWQWPCEDSSRRSLALPPAPTRKGDFSAPAFSQQLQGRCINPSRAGNVRRMPRGRAQVPHRLSCLAPRSTGSRPSQPALSPQVGLPGTGRGPGHVGEALGLAERDRGRKGAYLRTTYKDSVSCFGILCPRVQTTWRTGPTSQLREGLNVGVGSRSPPNKEKTEGAALGGSRLRLVLPWFFQSRKCSSSSSENRRPCRF